MGAKCITSAQIMSAVVFILPCLDIRDAKMVEAGGGSPQSYTNLANKSIINYWQGVLNKGIRIKFDLCLFVAG